MFCPNCGAEVTNENAKHCPKCGTSLVGESQSQVAQDEGAQVEQDKDAKPVSSPLSAANGKLIAIVAAIVVVAVVVTALVVGSCNRPQQAPTPTASTEPEPNPEPQDNLTPEERRDFFVGTWVAQDSTDPKRPKGWFESSAAQGVYVTLILWDDCTGVYRPENKPIKVSWDAESATAATAKADKKEYSLQLKGKKLTLKTEDDMEVYFVPETEVDMSNAVDLSHKGMGVTVDPNSIKPDQYSKVIGNESVGYMQIPQGWVNRVQDLDAAAVKSADTVYYADKNTEYLSPTLQHAAFSQSVQMGRYSSSYTEYAQKLVDAYKASSDYENVTTKKMTVGKRRAVAVYASNVADGVEVVNIVADRDNDEKVSVVLAFNCGTLGRTEPTEWALAFASTWQVE